MRGVITDYFPDRQFGFILDEEYNQRFFHISQVKEAKFLIENLQDYYYSIWVDRKLFAIDFLAELGKKGPVAKAIKITSDLVNDKSYPLPFLTKIKDVTYDVQTLTRISSGYKRGESAPFGATAGGNGTFRIGYPESTRDLYIHFQRLDSIGWGKIEVRNTAIKINQRSNITQSFVNSLKNSLVGKSVKVIALGNK